MGPPDAISAIIVTIRALGVPLKTVEAIETVIRNTAQTPQLSPMRTRTGMPPAGAKTVGQIARHFHRKALQREQIIDGLLSDSPWHMLLTLVADEEEGRYSCISDLCEMSGAPRVTALRQLSAMANMGLIERHDDPRDKRRVLINLSDRARIQMIEAIEGFCVEAPAATRIGAPECFSS